MEVMQTIEDEFKQGDAEVLPGCSALLGPTCRALPAALSDCCIPTSPLYPPSQAGASQGLSKVLWSLCSGNVLDEKREVVQPNCYFHLFQGHGLSYG